MEEINFKLQASDGKEIFVRKWFQKDAEPKAALQLVHGMGEHSARYADFAEFMVKNGFVVYANDHRGHGETALNDEELGFFDEKDGWNKVVEDAHLLSLKIKQDHAEKPLFLLGHSMGSFISRHLISLYGEDYKGVILSGTTGDPGAIASVGKAIGKLFATFQGLKAKNKFLHDTGFAKFNKPFKPNRTDFDWISRDEKVVDAYAADPKCGMIMAIGFILDLTDGLNYVNTQAAFENTPENLPIYLMSGAQDPVSDGGKGVVEVHKKFEERGIKNLEMKLFKDCRHEILNELNKEDIYKEILEWFEELMKN